MEMLQTESMTPPDLRVSAINLREASISEAGPDGGVYGQIQARGRGAGAAGRGGAAFQSAGQRAAAALAIISFLATFLANFIFLANGHVEVFRGIRDAENGLVKAQRVLQAAQRFAPPLLLAVCACGPRAGAFGVAAAALNWVAIAQDAIHAYMHKSPVFPYWSYGVIFAGSWALLAIAGVLLCVGKRRMRAAGDVGDVGDVLA